MNIVILPAAYPNVYNKNSSIFVQDQAKALAKDNVLTIDVIAAVPISFKDIWRKRLFKFGTYKYAEEHVKVKLFLFPAIPKMRRFNNLIRYTANKILLKEHNKTSKIDLIHVHNAIAGKAALWFKNRSNIPYCVTEHSSIYGRGLVSPHQVSIDKEIYLHSEFNIGVSKKFCEVLHTTFKVDFNYIPNIVDTDFFTPTDHMTSNQKFTFVNIANLNKNKNHLSLIRSFSKAFKHNDNVQLSILGDGPEYKNLTKEIHSTGMQEQISLYGFATRDEVLRQLQRSNVFVLSSDYETFGIVLIEALSCGLPVLSTKCGGPESIVDDDRLGLLVDKNDIKALANGMIKMYNKSYDPKHIRAYCIDNFSENTIVNKLKKIYEHILL